MPRAGPLTVTVPGAVDAWFALLERFGSRSFAELAAPALAYARDGFPLTARGAAAIARGRPPDPDWGEWETVYGRARAGSRLRQPGLAHTIEAVVAGGPDAYYRGPVAAAVAGHVQRTGGLPSVEDMAAHRGEWVEPVSGWFQGVEVVELPPNSQGTTALLALHLVEKAGGIPAHPVERHHLLIEAVKVALAERDAHLTDPRHMHVPPDALASPAWAESCRDRLGPRAASIPPARAVLGGTAYLAAVDSDGLCVSLIQSNFTGFGSGLCVPGFGVNLQNRGAYFSLDPGHVNVIAPRKRTLHTLMPAMALRDGRPWLVFGTMGADGQAQIQVQILSRLLADGDDVAAAVAAPRWLVDRGDGSLLAESRAPDGLLDGLRSLGHRVVVASPYERRMGHAQAILITPEGFAATSDPRAEGSAGGF
jgi:gamma-glutamyltranspeptidase/glutathione hydrolase